MSILFEPKKIGNLEIKNRFIRSATYYALADEEGFVGEPSVRLMKTLAENEVGLIITGHTYVLKNGRRSQGMNGIQDDDHIGGYAKVTDAVHQSGGHIAMQISHSGVQAMQAAITGEDYMAVSLTDDMPDFGKRPREMNEGDIEKIIEAFGQAARRAREAGFDGVQIHGAHGYLVSQFLSPHTNMRSDRWGGSPENRMRFVREITRKIKNQAGNDYPVMIKLGCRDYLEDQPGLTIEEGVLAARELEKEGISLIEISYGLSGPSLIKKIFGITTADHEAPLLGEVKMIREKVSIPLAMVTGMRSPAVMENIIKAGQADFISLCRPLIREPGLIKRWKEGDRRAAECISCKGTSHQSFFGCFSSDDKGQMTIDCRQLKKQGA